MSGRVPAAVWRTTPELVVALDEQLGTPVDSYVNGTQTWLTGDADGGETALEWRLHPVAGFRTPGGLSHYDLWETVVGALAGGADPGALVLGSDEQPLTSLWDGLECFPAHGEEIEPAVLAATGREQLHVPPDASGLVDHERIGSTWERSSGRVSIVELLLTELGGSS